MNRVSKKKEDYTQATRNVAALERAADLGLGRAPGQSVSYVVVDDAKQSRERVRLAHMNPPAPIGTELDTGVPQD